MKFCVKANLVFDTPAKRDNLSAELRDKLVDKLTGYPTMPIWGSLLLAATTEEGKAISTFLARLDNKADRDALFAFLKDRMVKIPVLGGRLASHDCHHDEGSEPCIAGEVFTK